jgi:hypothetical protein
MAIDRIRIDGKTYILAPGQDVAALKLAIEAAAHSGGAFVDFGAVGGHAVSVLISAGIPVRIESTEAGDAHTTTDGALPAVCDPADNTDYYDV